MKQIYCGIIFLIHLSLPARAQTPSVTVNYPEIACLGKIQNIPVTITGQFHADNKFTVQVKDADQAAIITTLPATLKGETMEVVYQDSTLSLYPMLQFRIVSSAPVTETAWTSFRVHGKGTIRLNAAISDTVNLGEELVLQFTTLSSTEVDLFLSDGTPHEITSYSPQSEFTTYHTISAYKTEPFYIKTATNACGAMRVSGQVQPVANRTSVRTKAVNMTNVCEGTEMKIAFTTNGPALVPGKRFRVRFRSSGPWFADMPVTVEASAELKDGMIVTRFPEHLKLQTTMNFSVVILADEQGIVGSPGSVALTLHPKPAVQFYTSDLNIKLGEETRVGVVFQGVPPFSAALGDGSVITADFSGEVYLDKSPGQTTTYSIKTMSSGCGITELPIQEKMTVNVAQGIALVPESNPEILCAGSKARVRIRSNGNFGAGTSYTVHAYYNAHAETSFPATRNGDYLEFNIPELPAGSDITQQYDDLYNMYVTSENPRLKSEPKYIYMIQSKPLMLQNETKLSYDEPGMVTLSYTLSGKGPFKIEDENGQLITVQNNWWAPEIFLDKTKDFKIKSISNACFKTENVPATRLTLNGNMAPGLYIKPVPARICKDDSLEVTMLTPGQFDAGNEFQIQAYAGCCDFVTLKTVRSGGTFKVKIPQGTDSLAYPAYIRAVSTNPLLITEPYAFTVDIPLQDFTAFPSGTQAEPALLPNTADHTLVFWAKGEGIKSLVYSDGKADKTIVFDIPSYPGIPITSTPGETVAYTLKSMANTCGTQQANLSTYIRIVPFQITIADFDFTVDKFCAGNLIQVPFGIQNGDRGNATFALEISRDDEINYRTIASGETSQIINAMLPEDLTEGYYKIRVMSSNGVPSNVARFLVAVAPSATISSSQPQPISLNAGAPLELDLHFTGTSPWTAVFEDNTSLTTNITTTTRKANPKSGEKFELKTVYNQCGYGKVSGAVLVNVKASLTTSATSYAACNGKTFDMDYALLGDADLSADYIRFELIDPHTAETTMLDSTRTKSGKIELKLPSNLTGSFYKIRTTLRNAALSSEMDISMTRPVTLTISGSTVINAGEQTQLIIHSDNAIGEIVRYELSDNTKGTFSGGSADDFILVQPAKTTTYTIVSASNSCGAGKTAGSATVEVNPASERMVQVTGFYSAKMGFCQGDTLEVSYSTTGTLSSANSMTVQLSDTTGLNFRTIPTAGNSSPLRAVLPTDLFPGKYYRIRIAASDPGTASGAYAYPLVTAKKSSAQFASDFVELAQDTDPVIVVLLSGTGPWQYDLSTENSRLTRYAWKAVDSVYIQQASPGEVYTLSNVYGQCGPGTIGTVRTVTVALLTGEPGVVHLRAIVSPNPTQDFLTVSFENASTRSISLFNIRGTAVMSKKSLANEESIDIRNMEPGVYLLQIEDQRQKSVFRVVKY